MELHFILAGRPVTREGVNTFGPGVTEEALDRIARRVEAVAAEIRCTKHDAPMSVTCSGPTLHELDFAVTACCPNFEATLADRLRARVRPAGVLAGDAREGVETTARYKMRRLHRSFGPIAAGLVIDCVDLFTYGPIKRFVGFPAGLIAGYWMASIFKLPQKQRLLCALAAGIYCFIPGLEFIPVATLIGAFARFREPDDSPEN